MLITGRISHQFSHLRQITPPVIKQGIKFALVGALNTAVDFGIYFALTRSLPLFATHPQAAKAISYLAGVINSFMWNRAWTFRSGTGWGRLLPFILANLAGLAINTGILHLLYMELHLPEIVALAGSSLLTIAWNFTLSKFVIFKR